MSLKKATRGRYVMPAETVWQSLLDEDGKRNDFESPREN